MLLPLLSGVCASALRAPQMVLWALMTATEVNVTNSCRQRPCFPAAAECRAVDDLNRRRDSADRPFRGLPLATRRFQRSWAGT
jgi:hypothetical protein